jgi:hypothetical protein
MAKKNSSRAKASGSNKPAAAKSPSPSAKPSAKPKNQNQARRDPLNTGGRIDPKSPPRRRNFRSELDAIVAAGGTIANAQADAAIRVNDRFQDSAQESTRDIAKELDNDYTRAAQANLTQAQGGLDQVNAASTGIGQLREQYAAQGPDPAMSRLNDIALGNLYRPDQIRSGQVGADQVTGARIGPIDSMQAAQLGQVANVQAATTGPIERVGGVQVGAVDPMEAARVRRVQDVQSQNVRASAAERGLMNEARGGGLLGQLESQASNDLALGRSLSAEQERDAIQSARAGAAARGLATGNSAMAAELLNRDRFATARENERRTFAGNVLGQGTALRTSANQAYAQRQDANAGRNLQAGLANQSVAANRASQNAQFQQQAFLTDNQNSQQRVLAEAGYAQQAGLSNQDFSFRAGSQNAQFSQQAGLQNQQTALSQSQLAAQLQQQANAANFASADQRATNNAQFAQQANLANQSANLNAAQYNVSQDMSAQMANQAANQQQEQYNRAFLGSVAGMNFDQSQGRTSMLSGLYGQQAGLGQTTSALNTGLAQSQVALDPYQRALGSNMPIATIGPSAGLIGQAYGQTMNYGSDLFNTNTNMQASMYNSFMNNQAALRGAGIQAGASAQSGQMGMMGAIGGGGLAAAGMIGGAVII